MQRLLLAAFLLLWVAEPAAGLTMLPEAPPPFEVESPVVAAALGEATGVTGTGFRPQWAPGPPFVPPRGRPEDRPPFGLPPGPPLGGSPGLPFEVPEPGDDFLGEGRGPIGSPVPEPAPSLLVVAGLLLGVARLRRR